MRVVLFDLFDTLLPGDSDERDKLDAAVAEALDVPPADFAAAFSAAARERYAGALGDLVETLRTVARRVGGEPTDDRLRRAGELRGAMTRRLLDAVTERTLSVLDGLRADGWRLGLVSNTTPGSAAGWRASRLPPYFAAAAFSDEVGSAKPDPGIYLAACRLLDAPPEICVYVGDGADDELAGPARLGMSVIRTTEYTTVHRPWVGPTIASLVELPALIGTPN